MSQSMIQPYPPHTAPANSVKGMLDMSTRTYTSEKVINISDPVSLVRTRPTSYAHCQMDFDGVPLIVETNPTEAQAQPQRQPTPVGRQEKMQQSVHRESQDAEQRPSAPANAIKSFLDMSPQTQQKPLEIAPDILPTEAVPLVGNKPNVAYSSVGVALIVEKSMHPQARQDLSVISTTETLHRRISTHHSNQVFSGSKTTYKDTHQQNTPVDFSAKDSLVTTNISRNHIQPDDGRPMNYTNKPSSKEMFERMETEKQVKRKPLFGIVDLTVDPPNKTIVISNQDAKDLSSPHLSSQSESSLCWQQQYIPPPTPQEVTEDTAISQSLQYMEYSSEKQTTIQPGTYSGRQSGTGLNSEPVNMSDSSRIPVQREMQPPPQHFAPQTMQDGACTMFSLNGAYQHVSDVYVESKKPEHLLATIPQLQTQHSVLNLQYQQPRIETAMNLSFVQSQPKPFALQRQHTIVRHDIPPRPKILIKQATEESYGSAEESPAECGSMTSTGQALPPFSIQQLHGISQTVPTPQPHSQPLPALNIQREDDRHRINSSLQSLNQSMQSTATRDYHAKEPPRLSKQPNLSQSPATVEQYQKDAGAITSTTTKHEPMPGMQVKRSNLNQGSGAVTEGPAVSLPPAGSSSVKGLISVFSGLGSQTGAVQSHHTHIVSTSVDRRTDITPTQTSFSHVAVDIEQTPPATPVVKTPETMVLSPQAPAVPSNRPRTPAIVRMQHDSASKIPSDGNMALTRIISLESQTATIESQYRGNGSVISGVRPQTSPLMHPVTCESPVYGFKLISISQDNQQPEETLKVSPGKELPHLHSSPANLPDTRTPKGILSEGSPEKTETLTEVQEIGQRSIYIGINCPKVTPVDTEQKPYVRLPHIFVSAASSPEEETNEHEVKESNKPELPPVSASEETTPTAVTPPDCKESLSTVIVAQSDISEDARTTEIRNTETIVESEQVKTCSPEMSPELTTDCKHTNENDSQHILTMKTSTTEATVSEAEERVQTREDCVSSAELSPMGRESDKSDITSVVKPNTDLPCQSDNTTVVDPKSEEHKPDEHKPEEPEHSGKGLFSVFTSATPQQTPSQTGLSILGGILPGSSTKDTPGTGLLSMFGGSNSPSSPGSKDPPLSTPQEPQGKGLFSMFGGPSSQPPPSPRGPTVGGVRPRGPPPKEPPGKGLFSMFGASAPQQPPRPRGQHGGSAAPRGPSTGSSIFGGILPGSTTNNDTSGSGLFSKFGGLGSQPQAGPRVRAPGPTVTQPEPRSSELPGKGLFSMFGGQSQQAPEVHPAAPKPPESEGIFKVPSVFSHGGSSDGNKSKTGFGLFGMSFMEETKTEPEITVTGKEEIISEQVKSSEKKDVPEEAKTNIVESTENVPSESISPVVVEVEQKVQDSNLNITERNTETSAPLSDPCQVDKVDTIQDHLPCDENTTVLVDASITDTPSVTSNLHEEETHLDQKAAELVHEEQSENEKESKEIKDTVNAEKEFAESETETLEVKNTDDKTDLELKSPSEKCDDMQMQESVLDDTDKNTRPDITEVDAVNAAVGGEIIPEVEKQAGEPLKVGSEEETAVADVKESTEEPLEVSGEDKTATADMDKITKEPLNVIDDDQAAVAQVQTCTEEVTVDESVKEDMDKPSSESAKGALTETSVPESVNSVEEDLKATSDEAAKESTETKLLLGEASIETIHGLEKPTESNYVAVVSPKDEENTVGTKSPEIVTSQAVEPPKGPSLGPVSPLPHQQPRPGMVRPSGPPGQRMGAPRMGPPGMGAPRMGAPGMGAPRMGAPRMGAPRMGGPRMGGPRHPGPQKPPESAPLSGFMSMFSTPNAPSKPSAVGGFFSSSPGSFFGSSPAPTQPQQKQQQQQQKSFFGLPSSIGTESLTNDLLGIFKGSEATKSEEQQHSGSEAKQGDTSANVTVSESTEKTDAERTPLPGDVHVKSTEETEVPEKGLVEETEGTDKTEEEESSLTESNMKTDLPEKKAEDDESLRSPGSVVPDKAEPPQAPESKGMFELPGLSASKFGFMSVAAEGTSSIGSLFSTTPSPATGAKAPQPQQTEGGLFSGFKNLSAGIFQDEKPTGKEETSSAPSMFGMKLGSMFGSSDPPKPESSSPVITAQPQSQSQKLTEEDGDPESEKLSPGSDETGSADASDTEGPTETSKTGSCDTLAQLQSDLPSDYLAEGLDKPQLKITTCEVDKTEVDTQDTMHAGLDSEQPKDLLTKEAARRPVEFVQ